MVCRYDNRLTDRKFAEMVGVDLGLDAALNLHSEELPISQVNSIVHIPKAICRAHHGA